MSDLIERLRACECLGEGFSARQTMLKCKLAQHAADRIEKLEAALGGILDEETVSVHVGYDNAVGGGSFVWAEAVRTDSEAFKQGRTALNREKS